MNRLQKKIDELKMKNRKALGMFVTAGYPTPESTSEIVLALEEAGADFVELGFPFSDPLADGPTIQQASEIALKNGMTLWKILEQVKAIRRRSTVPLVLMGYANPVFAYGLARFIHDASEAGVDGTIIADLPLEEAGEYRAVAQKNDLATIFLAAPTTSNERLRLLDEASTGFLYCVSLTGVTGQRDRLPEGAIEFLQRCKAVVRNNPILVGFGISSGEGARRLSAYADGVIVGSALINVLGQSTGDDVLPRIQHFTLQLREGLDKR